MTQNPLHQRGIPLFSIKPLKSIWCHIGRGGHGVAVHSMPCTSQSLSINSKKQQWTINRRRQHNNNLTPAVSMLLGQNRFMDFGLRVSVCLIRPGTVGMQFNLFSVSHTFIFFHPFLHSILSSLTHTGGHFGWASCSSYPIMIPASLGIRPQLHPFPFLLLTPSFHPANRALAAFKWQ